VITSKDNEKLKLIRRLRRRRDRDREGLFATEGEDLYAAGLAAGLEPVLVLSAAGAGLDGEQVDPAVLAGTSTLGSGTRVIAVWRRSWSRASGPVCVYLHGVGDPGNVGAVIRAAHALVEGSVALGPDCADPHSPKAVRASMGSVFGQPLARAEVGETPEPRVALLAHGGRPIDEALREGLPSPAPGTLCLGAERDGLPGTVLERCEYAWTIPLRADGAESLNVAAAAAIALQRLSSAAAEGVSGD
jgi:RNA methyltransferase, TrmH family